MSPAKRTAMDAASLCERLVVQLKMIGADSVLITMADAAQDYMETIIEDLEG